MTPQPAPAPQGAPPTPPSPMDALRAQMQQLESQPTWEDVKGVLEGDGSRIFRIDIETDSTIAADLADEQEGTAALLQGIGQFATAFGPAVQAGLIPMDAAKAMLLAAVRRAKWGKTVEDALDQIPEGPAAQQPPAPDPAADDRVRAQAELEKAQIEAQSEQAETASQERLKLAEIADRQHERGVDRQLKDRELGQKDRELDIKEQELGFKRNLDERDLAQRSQTDLDTNGAAKQAVQAAALSEQHAKAVADTAKQHGEFIAAAIPQLHEIAQQHQQTAQAHAQATADHIAKMAEMMQGIQAMHQEALKPKKISIVRDKKTNRVSHAVTGPADEQPI